MWSELFSSIYKAELTPGGALIMLCSALIIGLAISLTYMLTHKKTGYQQSFVITLIIMPATVSIILMLVGNSVARAFSLAGAFSLVRFRSAPGDPKDIAYIFFALALGLACGMGYIAYAALFTIIICAVMIILAITRFAAPGSMEMTLKITIPEDLNYDGVFEPILSEYTDSFVLKRVRTTDFGSLFELVYRIRLKNGVSSKELIDKLRTRNGNLNISLSLAEYEDRIYA